MPAFAQDVPANVTRALTRADEGIAAVLSIPADQRTFANTLGRLDEISAQLDIDTSLTLFMQYVHPDAKVRDGARAAEEAVTNWGIELGKNEDLYKAIKAFASTNPKLDSEQQRLMNFTMRDYRRSGMDLSEDKRNRLKEIEKELSKLGIEFEQRIAEDDTMVFLTVEELKGVPQDVISRLSRFGNVCMVGLDGPTYGAVMDYCEVETTRQKAQTAYRRRGGKKNIQTLEKLVLLRNEMATILGYKNTVDFEVEPRMAKNSATVKKFYDDLIPIVKKKADLDLKEFTAAKQRFTKNPKATFSPWDYSFYKNRLMKEKYAVDGEKVAEYFSMGAVVKGLFDITSKLYGIEYKELKGAERNKFFPAWHEDVKLYAVIDKAANQVIGHIYTDLYPRDNKYSHAACWGLQPGYVQSDGTRHLPLAALVCNFTKPVAGKPSLLPHDEVETFFHEFGHGLHNLFAQARYSRFAGAGVARDFVEAPSQMMENWVWSKPVLNTFAKHYKTGKPIPAAMLSGMEKARTLGSGIETQGQFFLGLMDYSFHTAPGGKVDTTTMAKAVYERSMPYKFTPNTYPQASFGHLVGYEGAYYGYMWSLVYAQDMFQRFEELGLTSPKAGMYYREKVLAKGGTVDEMAMLRDYLGREPKMEAFLRHLGLK